MIEPLFKIKMTSRCGSFETVITGYPLPKYACQRMIETLGGDTATRKFKIVEA